MDAPSWFSAARLGLFVHWDHASQLGVEISWPMAGRNSVRDISVEQYQSCAATFNPSRWDAREIAGFARRVGARYVVFTAKHHAGFAMFHTAYSEFSVESAPIRRDLVREMVDAIRAEGLKVGLYYSLSDWHNEYYPPLRDSHRPYVFGETPPYPGDEKWSKYLDLMFSQVRELLTNYGHIDIIWFDGEWERTAEQWKAKELAAEIRRISPGTLINSRLPGEGDFDTPEQVTLANAPSRPWESCMTMNETWGYNPDDREYKSSNLIIRRLIEAAAAGGNLLLNVSPTGEGKIPLPQRTRLQDLGRWLVDNGAAVFGTMPSPLEPWQFAGPSTSMDRTVYLFLLGRPLDVVEVHGVPVKRVRRVWELTSDVTLAWRGLIEAHAHAGAYAKPWLQPDPLGTLEIKYPADLWSDRPTPIGVQFEEQPRTDLGEPSRIVRPPD